MGVETPLSVHAAVDRAPVRTSSPPAIMAVRTTRHLPAGTDLVVAGHHHEIDGVDPVMITLTDGVAAYYVLLGTQSTRAIAPGTADHPR
ncbi:hypothetical protein [Brachybacterium sp. ACRRE]|uniref:hypothetical protein n=1 Tax=Brachybacterium sp. ACRRE TaxID=2918184 RepID=UPI001EF3547B|nr:hypothetical protein [Brachybacterium sp. ACRRE]MCG7310713.1 hypothetical protein [Brachybacterium sp. ACRRE]